MSPLEVPIHRRLEAHEFTEINISLKIYILSGFRKAPNYI